MARLFVAVWPDADALGAVSGLPRPRRAGVRWTDPHDWHVTLRFIGEAPSDEISRRLGEAALPAATLSYGPRVTLLGDRVLVVPVAGAEQLAAAVDRCTDEIGQTDRRPFVGHLTLARLRPGVGVGLAGTAVDAVQRVDRVALVASELGPSGPTYTELATFDCG